MPLNPIAYTERIVKSFLRYQLTAYPFSAPHLHAQMRELLSLDETRRSPLLKGPYVSLSRPFREGGSIASLVEQGVFHPLLRERIPEHITHLYSHQERAVRAIADGRTTLISTGTGSGKTECFLYPIVSRCLHLRDEGAPHGISAVIVYPMNALAEDQLMRLRALLAGTGIPFGLYVGKTPEREAEVTGHQLPMGASLADYQAELARAQREGQGETIYPAEEVCSRETMRAPGRQPRILLTNVKQLELLLTRQQDVELFAGTRLDHLVFDEAHTFTGALGAETACLVRRLRVFCGADAHRTICIATSATIVDRLDAGAARHFAARFFGVAESAVEAVEEDHEPEVWTAERTIPPGPKEDTARLLDDCVAAVEDETGELVRRAYNALAGTSLGTSQKAWPEALHEALAHNEIAYRLNQELETPQALADLPEALRPHIGRAITEAEILAWLTLAAAARRRGRPLLRPVVHAFVRGIGGAVVTFPSRAQPASRAVQPKLWLAAEDETALEEAEEQLAHFPVTTCTTCGQHYYVAFLKDFRCTGRAPAGGEAGPDGSWWAPLAESRGGKRVVLVDTLIGEAEEEAGENAAAPHERTTTLHFCRHCGAAHPNEVDACKHCGVAGATVALHAVRQKETEPGALTSCLSCGSNRRVVHGRHREPARPVRAVTVADVHVLTQDMVHRAERPRLLVFCDNRQDAAFQAGWMRDHARRFRLRTLMAEGIQARPQTIGDLTGFLDDKLAENPALSRALAPEVWEFAADEGTSVRHQQERRKYLRFQVLREATLTARQTRGLEPWGRLKVEYDGLDESAPWIQDEAHRLGLPAERLRDGVAGVLDYLRRRGALHDAETGVFGKYWQEGDREVQKGYLPSFLAPAGTKLRRNPEEGAHLIIQWLSQGGSTTLRQIAGKWGVPSDAAEAFLEGLFAFLVDGGFLVPVRLKGSQGRPLAKVSGVYQVNGGKLRLGRNHGLQRCRSCRRTTIRELPHKRCLAFRCNGELEWQREDEDNYDLQLLDGAYDMLRPEEHTAMVPAAHRERVENRFKGTSEDVNCLVCTPTLELGIDIGQLDAVLMRNVPPLPANYWQRAGRAGRRHRMAVDITYCRPVSHDRAYFAEPPKLLGGRIDPPAFNLRNKLMVAKHVHATVIARLHGYGRGSNRSEAEREAVRTTLAECLPRRMESYLFQFGELRHEPFDFSGLRTLANDNAADLTAAAEAVFAQGWPAEDADVATPEALQTHVAAFVDGLEEVVARLRGRLQWAMGQIRRLNQQRERLGTLEPQDESLFRRCDNLVKRLKGAKRQRGQAEGHDDFNTFSVLAAEGFLPGYGLEVGSVVGWAEIPFWRSGAMDFNLPRPPATALREYVPGNLVYANGHRFVARRFHREANRGPGSVRSEMPHYEVWPQRQAVQESAPGGGGALGAQVLQAMQVCDADLVHASHISDEEELRFQLGVAIYGTELGQHSGGRAYRWGPRSLLLRRGVRLRLVNVGVAKGAQADGPLGYPVCTVCGQSVSPLASERQLATFQSSHAERCRREPERIAFYANVTADALSLPHCEDATTAHSVLEALRFGATQVLDMHGDDLQVLVIGDMRKETVDALLWDPMPGGSGLLQRLCERFEEVVSAAHDVVEHCPAVCSASCVDCLQTFRNAYYHKHLDRNLAASCLQDWGTQITFDHDIPPRQPSKAPSAAALPVNDAETRLRQLLLAAGFPDGTRGEQIHLSPALGTTTPDVLFGRPDHDVDVGVCVYLDGLSEHLHGNPDTAAQDQQIRAWLRGSGYEVVEIPAGDLHDAAAMTQHFGRLATYLGQRELRTRIRQDHAWFATEQPSRPALRLVNPTPAERYRSCLPLVPLEAAAGAFGDPQSVPDESAWQWVEVNTGRTLRKGMFVAQVVGESMTPGIPNGAHCLFASPVTGTRQGRVVLAQLLDEVDPETSQRYTVKRYKSEKAEDENGWRHVRVLLTPDNAEYAPIVLTPDDESAVSVAAELVEVLDDGFNDSLSGH